MGEAVRLEVYQGRKKAEAKKSERCWFRHRWGKWKSYRWRGYGYHYGEKIDITELRQVRACKRCGYTQDILVKHG